MLWRGLGSATTRLAPLARAHWRPRQRTQDYNAPGMAVDISNEVLVSDHAPTRARPSPKPTACASLPHTFPLALSPEIPRELPLIRLITRSHASTPRTLHYMSYHLTIPTSSSSARTPSRSRLKAGAPSTHHDRGVGDGRVQAHRHDHAHDAAVIPPPLLPRLKSSSRTDCCCKCVEQRVSNSGRGFTPTPSLSSSEDSTHKHHHHTAPMCVRWLASARSSMPATSRCRRFVSSAATACPSAQASACPPRYESQLIDPA